MPVPTSDGTIQPSVRDTSTVVLPINTVAAAGAWILAVGRDDGRRETTVVATVGGCSLKSRVIQQGYCEYWTPNNSYCLAATRPAGGRSAYQHDRLCSQHVDPPGRPGNYCQLVSLCLLRLRCTRLRLSMSPTAQMATATGGIVQVRIVQLN